MGNDEVKNGGYPDGDKRVSDGERDAVVDILRAAAGNGRITIEELDERLGRVQESLTYADLSSIVADIPGSEDLIPSPDKVLLGVENKESLVLMGKGERIVRKGPWSVPGRIEALNPYGNTRLDFGHAKFTSSTVEVTIDCSWGQCRLVVPEGVTASIETNNTMLGSVSSEVPCARTAGQPHLVIRGKNRGGKVRVLRARV
ncbi:DUF1707 domain-containing protein [Nocardiopsis sp. CC223A]|uniref:DUF1707 SHOCT-like domain-containing protein n=1 Tax=Nocardiopsis sp. CC223A TaxID=3044051 RepID=UPI00278C3F6A|nr:DUF1707 domain-containing protein [Nocardiopsis sp. CC223A]